MKFGFEASPAPHSLHENRFEGEGSSDFVPRHSRAIRPTRPPQGFGVADFNVQFAIQNGDAESLSAIGRPCSMLDVRRFRADL